ncbi:MAG: serine hydroxymethyltransferase [Candidatus Odinarchaeota archaeon]
MENKNKQLVDTILGKLKAHHDLWENSIPLIASENITSPAVREAIVCDFSHRYAEGVVGQRVYAGCQYIDEVENICLDLLKDIYGVPFADVRPISGVVANLIVYSAFASANDTMMALSVASGGHVSHAPDYATSGYRIGGTAGLVSRLNVIYFPLTEDRREMKVDIDKTISLIREKKPKIVNFGASVFLFPQPVKEVAEVAREVGAHVNYDGAHVAGLIAGGQFQDPFKEGTMTFTASAHKTLWGPQKGFVLGADATLEESIQLAAFPGLTSNHHLNTVAGLAVALAEFKEFGKPYAEQVIKNAKALAKSLDERGFNVVAADRGYTESHTILVDIANFQDSVGLGGDIEKLLEKANIIINRNMLPWDPMEGRRYTNPGGIRLGTSEVTRLGMKEKEMDQIAEWFKKLIMDKARIENITSEITEFRKEFQNVHYAFPSKTKAYDYIKIA